MGQGDVHESPVTRLRAVLVLVALVIPSGFAESAHSSGCPGTGPNLVRDGSFEEPRLEGLHYRIVASGRRIGPWSVSGGEVDHIAPHFWEAAHGDQSLDLNSCGPAAVSQRVPTRPGDSYQLCFALSGNPDGPPSRKRLEVLWDGAVVDRVEFDGASSTRQQMGWSYHRYVVRAAGHDAVLSFRSLTPGCYGPVVDNVTLHRIPDPVVRGPRAEPEIRAPIPSTTAS